MKKSVFVALAFLAGTQNALANDCQQEFISLMKDRTAKEPTKILVTQQIKDGPKTINWNYQDAKGNWLSEMVEPENAHWSMGLNNVLYSSADKGATWNKIREMEDQNEMHQKSLDERAATVENAQCGETEFEGVAHKTIEADYKMLGSFNADIHDKFWVNAKTGYVSRLETNMKSTSFESFVIQELEPAPDLTMPNPE